MIINPKYEILNSKKYQRIFKYIVEAR